MDRKSIIVLVVCFALLVLWFPLVNKLYPPKPLPPGATNGVVTAGQTNVPSADIVTPPAQPPEGMVAAPAPALPDSATPEQLLVITNENTRYVFTSHGGGLKKIDLLQYPESPIPGRTENVANGVISLNAMATYPVLALLGDVSVTGDGSYVLTETFSGVRAEQVLSNGVAIVKEFEFGSNYMLTANVRFENRTLEPVVLPAAELVVGTATPLNPHDDGRAVGAMWYNGAKLKKINAGWFANRFLGCFPGTPRSEFRAGVGDVVWTTTHNQFFALAAIPETNAVSVVMRKDDLPKPSPSELQADSRLNKNPEGVLTSLVLPSVTIPPGSSTTESLTFFAGPKEYRRLARLAEYFGNNLDLVMGYSGFFGFFAKALLLSMNWVHDILGASYGLAIVIITVIIKLLFWPLTQASTRSMKRMQALQPQMKALQAKYKEDPAKMNKKLMEFMREHKVSPLGGCLPMILQIPVFFGFFRMIQSAIELRGAHFLWVRDLSQPDTLFMIPGLNFPFNLLPLIMGATMLWQARMTPPSPGMDPMQQKMMKYMPLMFLFILYNFSAGLTLYWTVQNLLTIAQMKLTRAREPQPAQAPAPAPVRSVRPKRSRKRK